jgi:hypothetical protein
MACTNYESTIHRKIRRIACSRSMPLAIRFPEQYECRPQESDATFLREDVGLIY